MEDDSIDRGLAEAFGQRNGESAIPASSVLRILQRRAQSQLGVHLESPDMPDPPVKVTEEAKALRDPSGRYQLLGEIGRGAIGTVYQGRDQDLGRDVAMKVLKDEFADRPDVLARFVEEAQIGGQLQHPGIVPVYDLGLQAGERPYFAMKLVKGETLAAHLAGRGDARQDRSRCLGVFAQVCQTVAYAHSRRVVHRDLKPANVMIGAFGEVQVVDWGFAKVLPRGGVADEKESVQRANERSVIETVRSQSHDTQSVMGSVMGTPAYMPPEQARGLVDQMDTRSDVFSLGAILCEILTGQPPYVGDRDQLIGMAAVAQLDDAHARLQSCGAEADLVDLVKRCLMPAPAARPRSAEVVAQAVHDHLASVEARVHDARVEAVEAKVRAASLKRVQTLGIALTTVIAVGLATTLWFWRDAAAQRDFAQRSADAAARAQRAAETNLANYNRLSNVVRLDAAKSKELLLRPAWPEQAQSMHDWLDHDADELRGALPELRSALADLTVRAMPESDSEQATARAENPRASELAGLERKLSALRSAQAVRTGAPRPEPFVLEGETERPTTARELSELAWPLVDPDRAAFGREAEGLALARRADTLVSGVGDDLAAVARTLAWSLFAVGLDQEAIEQGERALSAVGDVARPEYERDLAKLRGTVAAAGTIGGQAALEELAAAVAGLRADIAARRPRKFAAAADQFLHDMLRSLISDVEAFCADEVAAVERRLVWAECVEDLTITRHEKAWDDARLAILAADGVTASELYRERRFELRPQIGLVPIGMNPDTKLWEFYHLRSAWDPKRGDDPAAIQIPTNDGSGKLDMTGRGIVFVLIPGGRFRMGAQSIDESGPNFDPGALGFEAPVCEVELEPYFLAKYELTQGQWARMTGGQYPSRFVLGAEMSGMPVPVGVSHPVETVSWVMSDELMRWHGLVLPTEAQWEYAARAGTSTPWSTGTAAATLGFEGTTAGTSAGFANVLDRTGQEAPPEWLGGEAFDDRFKGPAPVGSYEPNRFGLHDVHGNVWEWCRDAFGGYDVTPRRGDGLRDPGPSSEGKVLRGGSFRDAASFARSAMRYGEAMELRGPRVGLRPAREITP